MISKDPLLLEILRNLFPPRPLPFHPPIPPSPSFPSSRFLYVSGSGVESPLLAATMYVYIIEMGPVYLTIPCIWNTFPYIDNTCVPINSPELSPYVKSVEGNRIN